MKFKDIVGSNKSDPLEFIDYRIDEERLDPNQIAQLFQTIEQNVMAGGKNRSLIGKGKDLLGKMMPDKSAAPEPAAQAAAPTPGTAAEPEPEVAEPSEISSTTPTPPPEKPVDDKFSAARTAARDKARAALSPKAPPPQQKAISRDKSASGAFGNMAHQLGAPQMGGSGAFGNMSNQLNKGEAPAVWRNNRHPNSPATTTSQPGSLPTKRSKLRKRVKEEEFSEEDQIFNESVTLTDFQIFLIINEAASQYNDRVELEEGIKDALKGAAGKIGNWMSKKGANITNKITADKLQQAWKDEGSPKSSYKIFRILKQNGVPKDIIANTFQSMGISLEPSGSGRRGGGRRGSTAAARSGVVEMWVAVALKSLEMHRQQ